jgi:hypothetical protein
MRLSLFHDEDVRAAARRVLTLSRERLGRVVGVAADREPLAGDNPYVQLFLALFAFARHGGDDATAATQLGVAESVLGNPLYSSNEGQIEAPLLTLVVLGAHARRKLLRGQALTQEERELLA